MIRTTCSGCGYNDLKLFLDLGLSPIADAYTTTANEISDVYPLQLAVCTGCWLVQLLEVVDHNVLFGTGYSFYSSASAPLSAYHHEYANDIIRFHGETAKQLTVEIGCNDGDMLQHFARTNIRSLGVDPAGGPVDAARARGLDVIDEPFNEEVAHNILNTHGPAGVVIANHVLAHVENVSDVLAGISALLDPQGVAYIEVQYLPDLLINNAFDLVYHEHRNFFSLSSLEKAAARHGLYATYVELTNRQGGSLRVAFMRDRHRSHPSIDVIRASESWLHSLSAYDGTQGRVNRVRSRLLDIVQSEIDANKIVIGYGAPAKATTLLNFCGIDSSMIPYVIDTTPAKQGRFIPGVGIGITSPADVDMSRIDACLMTAWNYAPTIIRNNRLFDGRWIIPIPAPIVL